MIQLFKIFILSFFILTFSDLKSQQSPMYSQYMFNDIAINPALAGSTPYFPIRASARNQWSGFEGAPQTTTLSSHGSILDGNIGIGALLFQDETGPVSQTGVQLAYSYHIEFYNSALSLGLAGIGYNYSLKENELEFHQTETQIGNMTYNSFVPDAAFGLYYYSENFYLGASVYQLFQNTFRESIRDVFGENKGVRHYFLSAGLIKEINQGLSLEPSVLIKTIDAGTLQADFNFKVFFNNSFWTGASFRTDKSAIALLGFQLGVLHISYAFDYSFTSIGQYSSGTHEISVGLNLPDPRNRRHIYYWNY